MKKAIFTLAVLVMAFGNASFAQLSKTEMKEMSKQQVLKQMGLVRDSYVVPQEADYTETDGTRHRQSYYYDESDFTLSEEIMETYEDDWTYEARALYEYDFNGNVLEATLQQWTDGDWQDEMKVVYDYDGDMLSEVVYQYNYAGVWMNVSKEVYNYSGDTWTVLYWMWNGTTWSSNELYTYTRIGNTIELLMQYMEGGAWQNEAFEITTLDFDENVTEILRQTWMDNDWANSERMTYHYEDGLYTEKYYEVWDDEATWIVSNKYVFQYDQFGNAKHGECFDANGTPADGDIEIAMDYNAHTANYYGHVVDVTYVDLTGVNENSQAGFEVYPLPAKDEIQIDAEGFQKAEIYSLTGQKLMESLQSKMNVSELATGVYLLKFFDQTGKVDAQRIVKK